MDKGTLNRLMKDWIKDAGLWGTLNYFVSFDIVERNKKDELDVRTTAPGTLIGAKGVVIGKYSYIIKALGIERINIIPIENYYIGKEGKTDGEAKTVSKRKVRIARSKKS